jgi:hypothetical protein
MFVDYILDKIRRDIADDIKYLELPPNWSPDQVIKYIVRIIENG